jgi:hypothetical protein
MLLKLSKEVDDYLTQNFAQAVYTEIDVLDYNSTKMGK